MPLQSGPSSQREPSVPALISFLFGLAERETMPGPALVALLGDLGVSPGAARSGIARMRAAGELAGTRRGRVTDYRLAGAAASGFGRARDLGHPDGAPAQRAWTGEFPGVLYSVPERLRLHRDRLRTAALLSGYASLRPGLLIGVVDRWDDLAPVVAALPEGATARPLALRLRPDDARSAASEAWGLPGLNRHLGRLAARLREALDGPRRPPPTGAAALQRLAELTLPVYHALIVVPPLPPELLPYDWCQAELVGLLGRAHERLGAAAQQQVHDRLDARRR